MRRNRLCIVAVVIWSLAFAQAAVAGHACSTLTSASPGQATEANTPPMPPGCQGMAAQSNDTLNVCESHCVAGQQVSGHADIPSASIAPQLALTVRVNEVFVPTFTPSSLAPVTAAPPPQLRFSRFLI